MLGFPACFRIYDVIVVVKRFLLHLASRYLKISDNVKGEFSRLEESIEMRSGEKREWRLEVIY